MLLGVIPFMFFGQGVIWENKGMMEISLGALVGLIYINYYFSVGYKIWSLMQSNLVK